MILGVVLAGLFLSPVRTIALPERVSIPIVSEHNPKADPPEAAEFSHWRHNQFQCYACHPAIFPQTPRGFTHDDMKAGAYCGACHDGRQAFDVSSKSVNCESCHPGGKSELDDIEDIDDIFGEGS